MALMEELVDELAERAGKRTEPESALFCRNVAQVRFNAWHYADSNLWASLAYRIFEGLAGGADDPVKDAVLVPAQHGGPRASVHPGALTPARTQLTGAAHRS